MHSRSFPPCSVDGPIEPPVPYGHGASTGAVPTKCSRCEWLFEAECLRYHDDVGHYLRLDHGPCGVDGPTNPVPYRADEEKSGTQDGAPLEVPRKCTSCAHLGHHPEAGVACLLDREKWGDFPRSFDWGSWKPDGIHVRLPVSEAASRTLSHLARKNDLLAFVRDYRKLQPHRSIQEARADFARIRRIQDKFDP